MSRHSTILLGMGEPGSTQRQKDSGSLIGTTEIENTAIFRSSLIVPDSLLLAIQHVTGTPVTARIIDRRLRKRNLNCWLLLRRLLLTCAHRPELLQYIAGFVRPGISLTRIELLS